jgi:hypothetical protein
MHGPVPLLRPAACAARAIDGWMPQDDDAGGRQDHRPRRVPSDWIICMDWIPIPPIVNMTDDVKAHRHAGRPATHGARRQGRGSTTTNTSPLPPRPRRRRRRRPERDHGINDELLPVACSVATGNPLLHTRASYPGAARRGVAWRGRPAFNAATCARPTHPHLAVIHGGRAGSWIDVGCQ